MIKGSSPVYVVANTLPAEFGWGTLAPGLRAQQLANQARRAGAAVTYIIFESRYNLLNKTRRVAFLVRPRADTLLIRAENMKELASRLPSGIMVFTQADFVEAAEAVHPYHRIVYDILAPKVLELEVGGSSQDIINKEKSNHQRMIAVADGVFVNGNKSVEYFRDDLKYSKAFIINPFACKPFQPQERKGPGYLIFGGHIQKWSKVDGFYGVMAEFFRDNRDVSAYFFTSQVSLNDPSSRHISAMALMPNVRSISRFSLRSYMELLAGGLGFIEVGMETEERKYATSTRVLQAIGAGLPVIHQPGTGLDSFWDVFPGKQVSIAEFNDQVITDFVHRAREGLYTEACREAVEAQTVLFNNPKPFEDVA